MDNFRFDDQYEKVYEFDNELNCYVYIGSYYSFGINDSMSYKQKSDIVLCDILLS